MKAQIKTTVDGDVKAFELPSIAIIRQKSTAISMMPEWDDFSDRAALVYEVLNSNPVEAKEAVRRWQVLHG